MNPSSITSGSSPFYERSRTLLRKGLVISSKTEKKHYSLPPVKEAESNVVFRRNNEK
uniref:Uncharacterized protein n=1 Tax=Myoviridae sp. ctLnO19 TaxID=2825085 RepID=A0A8S5P199_9CAUD|nr:MAG TPA: hypothetical protein [Myoviridae sp. ctLnO19]